MSGPLYLGWQYLRRNRWKTCILTLAIGLILFLPPAILHLVERGAESLGNRADSTPLLLGPPGSPLELTLNSLYFGSNQQDALPLRAMDAIDSRLATTVPLYVRFRARDFPIVGTSSEYFSFRHLNFDSGRGFALLGECVLGANVARSLGLSVGDSLVSSPESLFDLAGVYPLKMIVVGVLSPSFSPDDDAILTDLKTAWVIEGLGHGHQALTEVDDQDVVLTREDDRVTANAALIQFNEITEENRSAFHFHGDGETYPISAAIVIPRDQKAHAILLGRFLEVIDAQLLQPDLVIADLLDTVFTVRAFVLLVAGLVGVATLLTVLLVLWLSVRLREGEIATLQRIGAAPGSILLLLGSETAFVFLLGLLLAAVLLVLTQTIGTTQLVLLISR